MRRVASPLPSLTVTVSVAAVTLAPAGMPFSVSNFTIARRR
jgi:hypothetical protein